MPAEPVLNLGRARDWAKWLAAHHASSTGVLLRIAKRRPGAAGAAQALTYSEALDVALAWGWIDSQKRALDASAWLQRFTRRTAQSPWSKINRARAEALIAAGTMAPPGLAEVERASRDGRWKRAYDGARTSAVPADLAAALARDDRAPRVLRGARWREPLRHPLPGQTAKKPETRAERIARFVAMCGRHETLHPVRRR